MPTRPHLQIDIRFGNDAMRTPRDAADALDRIAHRLRQNLFFDVVDDGFRTTDRPILDGNGNRVGTWGIDDIITED